jgi:hypothetical protein
MSKGGRNRNVEHWAVKDKKRLLLAMMEALAGDAHLSFEGDLSGFRVTKIAGASDQETTTLKRNTSWPKQDFIVVPLEPEIIPAVLPAIGGNVPKRILHIQIEKSGCLEFAAYDRFHPECIVFGAALSRDLIDELVSNGVLKQERARPIARPT